TAPTSASRYRRAPRPDAPPEDRPRGRSHSVVAISRALEAEASSPGGPDGFGAPQLTSLPSACVLAIIWLPSHIGKVADRPQQQKNFSIRTPGRLGVSEGPQLKVFEPKLGPRDRPVCSTAHHERWRTDSGPVHPYPREMSPINGELDMRRKLIVLSMLLGSLPAAAQLSINFGAPGVHIGINVQVYPTLQRVPGYPVYYAPGLNSNYFFYDGMYWVYDQDNWYASSWYNGPWGMVDRFDVPAYVLRVPVRYYRHAPSYFHGWRADAAALGRSLGLVVGAAE